MQHMEKSSFAGRVEILSMDSAKIMFMGWFPAEYAGESPDGCLLYTSKYSLGGTPVLLMKSAAIERARGCPPRAFEIISKSESKIG